MLNNKMKFITTAILIALPVVMQNTLVMVVNMIDTIMLSTYGDIQISASSLANDFIGLFQILCMGMGGGAAVLTAQYWGNQNIKNLKKTISMMLRVSISAAAIFSFVILLFSNQVMSIYTNDSEVIQYGSVYFLYSIPTFFLMGITITISEVLRSMRKVKVPLYASIASVLINVFANWVFIFGNLGMPEMQIAGAALGTVISRVVETIIVWIYLLKLEKDIQYKITNILEPVDEVKDVYIKYSVPVIVSDLFLGFGNSATSIIIGHIGTTFASANSIIVMIQRVSTTFTMGLGNASHTLIGNTVGKNEKEIAQHQAVLFLKMGLIFGLLSACLIYFVGPFVLDYFSNLSDDTLNIASQLLNALTFMIVFQAMQAVITKGIMRGGGDTDYCLKLDMTFLWFVSIPMGTLSGLVWHWSPFYILICLHLDWIIKTMLGVKRILSGKWIKSVT